MARRRSDPGGREPGRAGGPPGAIGGPAPGPVGGGRPPWPGLASAVILAAGSIAAYSQTLSVPLLMDDLPSIRDNPSIRHLWPVWPVLSPPAGAGVAGRPVLNLSYALNYAAGGTGVAGYHVANLAIHVLASWALFALVRRILARPVLRERFGPPATGLALAVSAIWAWHPLVTESVTYVSQRAESLMGLFYLLTLLCAARGWEADAPGARRVWTALSVLSCLAGAGTKEVIVTAPLVALLLDRAFYSGSFAEAWRRHRALYLALAAALLPLGYRAVGLQGVGVGFGEGIAWWAYGLAECRAVVKYALLAFWPSPLVFDYGRFTAPALADVWPYALVLGLLLAGTLAAWLRSPPAGFAAVWFFLILAPSSSIVPVAGEPMAENRMYLPLAGLAALSVLGGYALAGRRSLPVFALVAVTLAAASARRNQDYASERSIWADAVESCPANARARTQLGNALLRLPGRSAEAIYQLGEALRLDPNQAEAHVNLGNALNVAGRMPEAMARYEEALRLRPDLAEAHLDFGMALARQPGRQDEAISQFREALRLRPDLPEAHLDLGNALADQPGRLGEAIAQYEEALRLAPGFVEAHSNLGRLLTLAGRPADAVAHLEEALRQRPGFAEAHFNLALALLRLPGRRAEAEAQLEEGLRIEPGERAARQILDRLRASHP